jgi:methylmalonyl-CoA/ethylmalonyl-CoA epimerase
MSKSTLARRIDHVGIAVHDAAATAALFRDRFGTEIEVTADLDDGSARLVYLQAGDTTLQLVQPLQPGPLADFLARQGEGLHHVCLAVDSLDRALAALPGETGTIGGAYMGGRGCRVVFTRQPMAGVLIELTETGAPTGPTTDVS